MTKVKEKITNVKTYRHKKKMIKFQGSEIEESQKEDKKDNKN